MADLDAVNLGLDETERDIAEELENSYDTRSEASGASSDSTTTNPSISEVSSDSSDEDDDDDTERRNSANKKQQQKKKNKKKDEKQSKKDAEKDSANGGGAVNANNSTKKERKSRSRSPQTASSVTETKRNRTKNSSVKNSVKSYDYVTKINYLFRETRFFLIKSNNTENVTISKTKGVWSTLPPNEANLNQAFRESRNVILVFSVKESGKFAGFARMAAEARRDLPAVEWVLPPGMSAKALGGVIKIDWVCKKELPFTTTTHLYNPWNENKPVKIGRDGQEIESKVAEELCRLFPEDTSVEMTPILKKSKEASKQMKEKAASKSFRRQPNFSRPSSSTRGRGGLGSGNGGGPIRGGRRKIFHGKGRPPMFAPYRKDSRRGHGPRLPPGMDRAAAAAAAASAAGFHGWERYSSTAAAEAYVADYMRTMQHQLPPMPYAPPPGFPGMPMPYEGLPPPPRYYEGLPIPEYPFPPGAIPGSVTGAAGVQPPRSNPYDKYDEFMWKPPQSGAPATAAVPTSTASTAGLPSMKGPPPPLPNYHVPPPLTHLSSAGGSGPSYGRKNDRVDGGDGRGQRDRDRNHRNDRSHRGGRGYNHRDRR
ncbi:YTH domain-containing protein 1 [Toxorhynchites rutilus septentrionalis]|uniref:YTH domain-containing protein 1 n=1 Tax=Toxorhynchites rutilus septentrionalis TaxID=329112 RepID=UPI00247A5A7D|nr:YTH domain-containing protein 1 [Toxorhynchites rutilus septentrionalis]XP_055628404.1 YTH domain-containing protein 1 [Toxorhynchites rutilus septentrionalis]XP_055628405.1 YTH domain-containing protein 1 [Toxorhynchites rutilus septentrionalis]XP_055628406.1 YTH domain-containing protein 1 [Toxorhynchites rutilus septentrionalis]